ncbi:MAG: hypothetical protein ACLTS1_08105 [Coprococcus sp.]
MQKENQIRNVRFFQGDAGEFMEAMAAEGNSMDVLVCGSAESRK